MAGYAIGKSMNLGFPGTYARTPDDVIMSRAVKEDSKAIPFGAPVILNSDNTYSVGDATLTADNFAGVAVRIVQQAVQYLAQNSGAYQPTQPCSVIQRGNVMVTCNVGTPTAGGKVYVRTAGEKSIVPYLFCESPEGGNCQRKEDKERQRQKGRDRAKT